MFPRHERARLGWLFVALTSVLVFSGGLPAAAEIHLGNTSLSNSRFSFTFNSVSGESYEIQRVDQLESTNWMRVATLTATGASTAFSEAVAGSPSRLYHIFTNHAGVYSDNAVGFLTLSLKAGSNWVINPFRGASDQLSVLIPTPPTDTTVRLWNSNRQDWDLYMFLFGTWSGDATIPPNQGFIVDTFTAFNLTFFGEFVSGSDSPLAPAITSQPQNQTVVEDANVVFNVIATGTTPLRYLWQKNGMPLIDAANVTGTSTATLALSHVQTNDAGAFQVVVTNSLGCVTSTVAQLIVLPRANLPSNPTRIIGWGSAVLPTELSNFVAIATKLHNHSALRDNGTVAAWGSNASVPGWLSNVVAIAQGAEHRLALRADGTIVEWNLVGTNLHSGLSNVVAIAAGGDHSLALRGNGTVAAWGGANASDGQTNVPAGLTNVIAIAAGESHSLALRSDGTVVAWGKFWNNSGMVPMTVPAGLSNVVAIAAGGVGYSRAGHSLALRSNGTVVAWGNNQGGQINVPAGLANVKAISAGWMHSLALLANGTVVAWGDNGFNQSKVPTGLTNVIAIAAGFIHSLALTAPSEGQLPPALVIQPQSQTNIVGGSVTFTTTAIGAIPLSYQWQFNNVNLPDGNSRDLVLPNLQTIQAGQYSVVITNAWGSATSQVATLTVWAPPIIATTWLPEAWFRTSYTKTLAATGGQPPYSWKTIAGTLAPGLTFNDQGIISGVPTALITNSFQVQVTDAHGLTAGTELRLVVGSLWPIPVVATSIMPRGLVNVAYHQQVLGTNGTPPYQWTLVSGALPSGVTLSNSGIISGTPSSSSSNSFRIRVTDANLLTADRDLILMIDSWELAPVQIVQQPQSQSAPLDGKTTFSVTCAGFEPIAYQWLLNGQKISSYFDGTREVNATGRVYTIDPVDTSHAGDFSVIVSNRWGMATSAVAHLEVIMPRNDIDPKFLGSWPGFPRGKLQAVTVRNQLAYCITEGGGLAVLDITEAAQPKLVGGCDVGCGNSAKSLILSGDLACLADDDDGLRVVNISNPAKPTVVGSFGERLSTNNIFIGSMAVLGNYVYLTGFGDEDGWDIISLHNPAQPKRIKHIPLDGASRIFVAGQYAYLARVTASGYVLDIFDLTQPTSPRLVGSCPATGIQLFVNGTYAYIAAGKAGVEIIDVSDPVHPQPVARFTTAKSAQSVFASGNLVLIGEEEWIGDSQFVSVEVMDVANPFQPRQATTFSCPLFLQCAHSMFFSNNLACLPNDAWPEGIMVMDLHDPMTPKKLGSYSLVGRAWDVALSDDYAYLADGDQGLQVIDLRDPTNLRRVGQWIEDAAAVELSGHYAYVSSRGGGSIRPGLAILDVSDPTRPQLTGRCAALRGGSIPALAVAGHYAYHVSGSDQSRFEVIDVTNPVDPQRVGSCSTLYNVVGGIKLFQNYAYVNVGLGGVDVLDISNPTAPRLVGSTANNGVRNNPWSPCGIELMDRCAYITSAHDKRILILDVSLPDSQRLLSWEQIKTDGGAGLALAGNYLYVAGRFGLDIHEVRHPLGIRKVWQFGVGSGYMVGGIGVAVSEKYACLAADAGGLHLIDISQRANPQRIGVYSIPATDVAVSENVACVSTLDGVRFLNVSQPASPSLIASGSDEISTNALRLGQGVSAMTGVCVSGTRQYAILHGQFTDCVLLATDISNPSLPQYLGEVSVRETDGYAVFVSGQRAYMTAQTGFPARPVLIVFNVSNPRNMAWAGRGELGGHDAFGLYIANNYAYVAAGEDGLKVLSLSNLSAPSLVGHFTPARCYVVDVCVAGNIAYVLDWTLGLHILDISQPTAPKRVGGNMVSWDSVFYGGLERFGSITVAGGYVYIAALREGLFVFNAYHPGMFELSVNSGLDPLALHLRLNGPPGQAARIQRSLDLRSWQDWRTVTCTQEPTELIDNSKQTVPRRFYRTVSP